MGAARDQDRSGGKGAMVSVWSGVEVRCEKKREGLWGRIGKGGNDGIRI
jgi:hypothetical protein